MKLDPTKLKDWQIAEAAEAGLRSASDLAKELGLAEGEWTPYGDVLAKIDGSKTLRRVGAGRRGRVSSDRGGQHGLPEGVAFDAS